VVAISQQTGSSSRPVVLETSSDCIWNLFLAYTADRKNRSYTQDTTVKPPKKGGDEATELN